MRKSSVNLLQQRGAPPTFWERAYEWVTNTCRMIVIITELFVLGAFGWRFWLDRRLNDLKEAIEQKGQVLRSLSSQEEEIRLLQARMATYKGLWEESSNYTPIISEINSYIPSETVDLLVSINKTDDGRNLLISGELERSRIDELENSLKDSQSFTDVTMAEMDSIDKEENTYDFTLSAEIIYKESRDALSQI